LFSLAPRLHRELGEALASSYPDHAFRVPPIVRFGSWIGGDRDGNPFVTPEITVEAARLLRAAAIRRHMRSIEELGRRLSQSTRQVGISPELVRSLADDDARDPALGAELAR